MFIEIPVYYFPDNYDPEKDELLQQEPKIEKGTIFIDTNHICAFNEHDCGDTMVRLTNGEVFQSPIKPEEFKAMLDRIGIMDLLFENEN